MAVVTGMWNFRRHVSVSKVFQAIVSLLKTSGEQNSPEAGSTMMGMVPRSGCQIWLPPGRARVESRRSVFQSPLTTRAVQILHHENLATTPVFLIAQASALQPRPPLNPSLTEQKSRGVKHRKIHETQQRPAVSAETSLELRLDTKTEYPVKLSLLSELSSFSSHCGRRVTQQGAASCLLQTRQET